LETRLASFFACSAKALAASAMPSVTLIDLSISKPFPRSARPLSAPSTTSGTPSPGSSTPSRPRRVRQLLHRKRCAGGIFNLGSRSTSLIS
jgi:hypothetical protein